MDCELAIYRRGNIFEQGVLYNVVGRTCECFGSLHYYEVVEAWRKASMGYAAKSLEV